MQVYITEIIKNIKKVWICSLMLQKNIMNYPNVLQLFVLKRMKQYKKEIVWICLNGLIINIIITKIYIIYYHEDTSRVSKED